MSVQQMDMRRPKVAPVSVEEELPSRFQLVGLKQQQQQVNHDEIYDHFECNKLVPDHDDRSEVAKFYKNRSVFITGASGFVGKCLVEKLVRSCPDIKSVYILMRPKRGVEIEERVNSLFKSDLFSRLRNSPNGRQLLAKIKPIRGDITLPLLGVSEEDARLLSEEVSLLFHSAATVKFVEPLKVAVTNNLLSVGNLLDLASRMAKLETLVHLSTAYSNCDRHEVDEQFYSEPIEAERLMEMANWMEPEMFERIAPSLVGARPNTYTYTKAVAESLLFKRAKQLIPHVPIALIRPSIVTGTWQQPLRGWVDNFNGLTGVMLSMATGALQAMPTAANHCADIVPVDIVANLTVCSPLVLANERRSPSPTEQPRDQIKIFNCVSGDLNPICWENIVDYVKSVNKDYPINKPMRDPAFLLMSNEHLFSMYNFFSHKCLAYLGDFCLGMVGRKTHLVPIYNRLNKMVATLRPFTENQWKFKCANVTTAYESLNRTDKSIFNFDVRQVNWKDYMERYYIGSKTFALKDDANILSNARRTRTQMKTVNLIAQLILLVVAFYLLVGHYFENKTNTITTTTNGLESDLGGALLPLGQTHVRCSIVE